MVLIFHPCPRQLNCTKRRELNHNRKGGWKMFGKIKKTLLLGGSVSLLVAGLILFLTGLVYSVDIHEINLEIQAKAGKWFAKETPLSYLTPEEIKKWTGALEPVPNAGLHDGESSYFSLVPLSSSFDWTSSGYVTPVRNQGGGAAVAGHSPPRLLLKRRP
jgi:hypothetical protein